MVLTIWPGLKKELKAKIGEFSFALTQSAGHAEELARTALNAGHDWIIAIGGDGTLSDVANGFFKDGESVNSKAVFSFLMLGTGSDFQRNFHLSHELLEKISTLERAPVRELDLGRVEFMDSEGKQISRYFLNVASFGISGEVDIKVNKAKFTKIFGGWAVFFIATFLSRLSFAHPSVTIDYNGKKEELEILAVALANGKYFGGGMKVAPDALLDDGLLDLVILKKRSLLNFFLTSTAIYFGKHTNHPANEFHHTKKLSASSEQKVVLDIDGEPLGQLPATFEILPRVLKVKI